MLLGYQFFIMVQLKLSTQKTQTYCLISYALTYMKTFWSFVSHKSRNGFIDEKKCLLIHESKFLDGWGCSQSTNVLHSFTSLNPFYCQSSLWRIMFSFHISNLQQRIHFDRNLILFRSHFLHYSSGNVPRTSGNIYSQMILFDKVFPCSNYGVFFFFFYGYVEAAFSTLLRFGKDYVLG